MRFVDPASRRCPACAQRGFTLVEMLMVMVVTAMLLAIGVPAFTEYSARSAMRSHVTSLASSIGIARSEAVKRGRTVTICPSADPDAAAPTCTGGNEWRTGWILFVDGGALGTVDGNDRVVRVVGAAREAREISSDQGAINFFANGLAIGGARTFTFKPRVADSASNFSSLARKMCVDMMGKSTAIGYTESC